MSRHPADLFSLVSGLIVLAVGLVLLTGGLGDVPMGWVGPAAAIGLGLLIVAGARPERPTSPEGPSPDQD